MLDAQRPVGGPMLDAQRRSSLLASLRGGQALTRPTETARWALVAVLLQDPGCRLTACHVEQLLRCMVARGSPTAPLWIDTQPTMLRAALEQERAASGKLLSWDIPTNMYAQQWLDAPNWGDVMLQLNLTAVQDEVCTSCTPQVAPGTKSPPPLRHAIHISPHQATCTDDASLSNRVHARVTVAGVMGAATDAACAYSASTSRNALSHNMSLPTHLSTIPVPPLAAPLAAHEEQIEKGTNRAVHHLPLDSASSSTTSSSGPSVAATTLPWTGLTAGRGADVALPLWGQTSTASTPVLGALTGRYPAERSSLPGMSSLLSTSKCLLPLPGINDRSMSWWDQYEHVTSSRLHGPGDSWPAAMSAGTNSVHSLCEAEGNGPVLANSLELEELAGAQPGSNTYMEAVAKALQGASTQLGSHNEALQFALRAITDVQSRSKNSSSMGDVSPIPTFASVLPGTCAHISPAATGHPQTGHPTPAAPYRPVTRFFQAPDLHPLSDVFFDNQTRRHRTESAPQQLIGLDVCRGLGHSVPGPPNMMTAPRSMTQLQQGGFNIGTGGQHLHTGPVSQARGPGRTTWNMGADGQQVEGRSAAALSPRVCTELAQLVAFVPNLQVADLDENILSALLSQKSEDEAVMALRGIGSNTGQLVSFLSQLMKPGNMPLGGMTAVKGRGPAAEGSRAMLQRLPMKVAQRLEEVMARCPALDMRHIDAGVIRVMVQVCEMSEEEMMQELNAIENTDLSKIDYMPAYLNKRLNNRLWSKRNAYNLAAQHTWL